LAVPTDGAAGPGAACRAQERPFSVLEDVIMASDRRSAPLSVGMIARTCAAIDPVALRKAVRAALARYPMARARLRTGLSGRRWWWFPDAPHDDTATVTAMATVTVLDGDGDGDLWEAFADICSRPFDLTAASLLRVLHMRLPDGDAVALATHHVALDGVSVALLLRVIMERSAALTDPQGAGRLTGPPPAAGARGAVGSGRPAAPGCMSGTGPDGLMGWRRSGRAVLGRWLPGRIAASTAPGSPGTRVSRSRTPVDSTPAVYGVHCEAFSVPESGRSRAGGPTATINDLLLAAAQLAVERWNTAAGQATGRVRVRMPINLREPDTDITLGNHAGDVMIATTSRQRRDPATALAAVAGQTAAGKAARRPSGTGIALSGLARLPAPARHPLLRLGAAMARPGLMPTTSVTNLGRIPDLRLSGTGSPQVTSLHFAAFAGPPQGLVITAVGYNGTLHLTFCYHRDLFDQSAARRFAALYRTALGALT
jgi:NRPS condensation-like uncharacterized protein